MKRLMILSLFILIAISNYGVSVSGMTEQQEEILLNNRLIEYSFTYDFDITDLSEKVRYMDNIIIVKIDSFLGTFDDDSEDFNTPDSRYNVSVVNKLKSNIDEESFNISISGGIDKQGYFHGVNLSSFINPFDYLPELGEYYLISFSSSRLKHTIGDSFYNVSVSEYIIRLTDYNEERSISMQPNIDVSELISEHVEYIERENNINDYLMESIDNSILAIPVYLETELIESGTTFDTAWSLTLSVPKTLTLSPGEEIYYKFTTTDTYSTSFFTFSIGAVDTFGYLYDSDRNLIQTDNDSGVGLDFLMKNWELGNYTYYIKVTGANSSSNGRFKMIVSKDPNCSCINDVYDVTKDNDAVPSNNEIDYHFYSLPTDYQSAFIDAKSTWNGLGEILIKENGFWDIIDLGVYTYSDNDLKSASFIHIPLYPDQIQFNSFYMDSYSPDQKESIALHELGHALGLAHMHLNAVNDHATLSVGESDANVMSYSAPSDLTILGPCDKNAYYYLWK